ncbi:hypothetical protein AAFF_G00399740 [Aldrovandia affinis]|uniref:Uncharacterized protein n=1 Tax=Aldrovandia affinis TaxID=143900 RepID=A0AAD7SCW4_9TELE|nr:hypothetical protein AAFF_G00399740 [Aldrovandia affinis]
MSHAVSSTVCRSETARRTGSGGAMNGGGVTAPREMAFSSIGISSLVSAALQMVKTRAGGVKERTPFSFISQSELSLSEKHKRPNSCAFSPGQEEHHGHSC